MCTLTVSTLGPVASFSSWDGKPSLKKQDWSLLLCLCPCWCHCADLSIQKGRHAPCFFYLLCCSDTWYGVCQTCHQLLQSTRKMQSMLKSLWIGRRKHSWEGWRMLVIQRLGGLRHNYKFKPKSGALGNSVRPNPKCK